MTPTLNALDDGKPRTEVYVTDDYVTLLIPGAPRILLDADQAERVGLDLAAAAVGARLTREGR